MCSSSFPLIALLAIDHHDWLGDLNIFPPVRLRQVDVKAEHFERQVVRAEKERDAWEQKYEVRMDNTTPFMWSAENWNIGSEPEVSQSSRRLGRPREVHGWSLIPIRLYLGQTNPSVSPQLDHLALRHFFHYVYETRFMWKSRSFNLGILGLRVALPPNSKWRLAVYSWPWIVSPSTNLRETELTQWRSSAK